MIAKGKNEALKCKISDKHKEKAEYLNHNVVM